MNINKEKLLVWLIEDTKEVSGDYEGSAVAFYVRKLIADINLGIFDVGDEEESKCAVKSLAVKK